MIRLPGRGIHYGEVWFDEQPEHPMPDVLICRQRPEPWPGAKCEEFRTLVLDLSAGEETLFRGAKKDTRSEIRRAGREGATFSLHEETGQALQDFCDAYDRFAAASGMTAISRRWVEQVASQKQLVVTSAGYGGAPVVWHSYYVGARRARLVHSASLLRGENSAGRARVGRLNRWLHWQDIVEFKRRGLRLYDFGGLFADESTPSAAGINRFKAEFGGIPRREWDCIAVMTVKGRGYLALQRLWRWGRNGR